MTRIQAWPPLHLPLVGRIAEADTQIRELGILFGPDGRVRKFRLQDIRVQQNAWTYKSRTVFKVNRWR